MIREIGCNSDGGVWISLLANIGGENQTAIIPLNQDQAQKIYFKLGEAIAMGATWKKTGVKPNVGDSSNPNKGSPKRHKRNRNG